MATNREDVRKEFVVEYEKLCRKYGFYLYPTNEGDLLTETMIEDGSNNPTFFDCLMSELKKEQ